MKQHAIDLGVPEKNIFTEDKSTSTYENADFVREIIKKSKYTSAIIVTSDYHMKRTMMIFTRVFKGDNITLTYCSVKDDNFNSKQWWKNNKSIMITISEYLKLIGYFFGKNI